MKIDGVSFADGFVESFKTQKDFLSEMEAEGYKHIFADASNRKGKLKEVYNLHNPNIPEITEGSSEENNTKEL